MLQKVRWINTPEWGVGSGDRGVNFQWEVVSGYFEVGNWLKGRVGQECSWVIWDGE